MIHISNVSWAYRKSSVLNVAAVAFSEDFVFALSIFTHDRMTSKFFQSWFFSRCRSLEIVFRSLKHFLVNEIICVLSYHATHFVFANLQTISCIVFLLAISSTSWAAGLSVPQAEQRIVDFMNWFRAFLNILCRSLMQSFQLQSHLQYVCFTWGSTLITSVQV